MRLVEKSCSEFTDLLASKAAVPGGGAVAALIGAMGTALASMVCNLTIGKKKYAAHEPRLKQILNGAETLQKRLLPMVDEDAEHFLPLSRAYGLPANTEGEKAIKAETMEKALKAACDVPLRTVRTCYEAIRLHEDLVDKGSQLVISDVGVGVQCLRAALISGQLNVMINIGMIKDQDYVGKVKTETDRLVRDGIKIADEVYKKVENAISG